MQSIKENGQREAVAVDDEQKYLIAGRHRREACRRLGITPRYKIVEISGEDYEAVARFVADENLVRFHLDAAQQAIAGAKLANLRNGERASSRDEGKPPISRSKASEITGASTASIDRAKAVLDKGAPALIKAVQQGTIGLREGELIARKVPKDEQAGVVARPREERRASISPRPLVHLGDRAPEEFEAATALIGLARAIVREAQQLDIDKAVRGLAATERPALVRDLAAAQDWIGTVSATLAANEAADEPIAAPEQSASEATDMATEGSEPDAMCVAPHGCHYSLCESKGQCLHQLPGRVDEERPVAAEPLKPRPVYAGDVLFDEVDP
jgi:ParB-like chromosome segregation protein Spo0J